MNAVPPGGRRLPLHRWIEEAPLRERGWTIQERALCPRTLKFGTSLIWERCESLADEYGKTFAHVIKEPL